MLEIVNQLRIVAEDLELLRIKWALIGGLAVSVHSEPRTTRDIDIAVVAGDKTQQEHLIQSLLSLGYSNRQVLMHLDPTHKLGERLQVRGGSSNALPLDLLFASSGIESEIVVQANIVTVLPGLSIPVARLGHVLAMKVLSQNDNDRMRDRLDAENLIRVANEEDLMLAQEALSQITQRGFSRGHDLLTIFSQNLLKRATSN